jgi:hypothetical protein
MNQKFKNSIINEVNKRGLITESAKSKDFIELISLLFHSRTQAHIFHAQVRTLSEHSALNTYYDDIVGMVDGLIESYQGKYSILKNYKSYPIENYKDSTSLINYFKELCNSVEELRDCCEDSYIQNQIDNVCQLINSTLYKLRFLK